MVELIVKPGPKGQVVIPKLFRDNLKIYPNQEIVMKLESNEIIIKKLEEDPIELLRKISEEATKRRKGKKLRVNPHEIYEQYEKRAKRAGL